MPDQPTINRARFLLGAIFREARLAFIYLHRRQPRIFARGASKFVANADRLNEVTARLADAAGLIESGQNLNWDALEDVGLTGPVLEWKADLIYDVLGRTKPTNEQGSLLPPANEVDLLSYPKSKPIWSRLFKYLKSLFDSLINAITNNQKLRLILDFIREYIECVDASLKFVQSGQEA